MISFNKFRTADFARKILFRVFIGVIFLLSLLSIIFHNDILNNKKFFLYLVGIIFSVILVIELLRWLRPLLPKTILRPINLARSFIVEIFAIIFLFHHKFLTKFFKSQKNARNSSTPFLLVHGFKGGSSNWDYIYYRLSEAELGPIYTITLLNSEDSIANLAIQLGKKIDQIKAETSQENITLVGYSLGGLVSTYYSVNMAPKNIKKNIITIATPHHGTKIALIDLCPCVIEFQYESPFIQKLNEDLKNDSSIRLFNIFSLADLMVLPNRSAHFDEKTPCQIFEDVGHISMLFSDNVADALVRVIEELELK